MMIEYVSIKDFLNNCSLFTIEEKKDIITEGRILGIDILSYINFEVNSLKQVQQEFKNQIHLIY